MTRYIAELDRILYLIMEYKPNPQGIPGREARLPPSYTNIFHNGSVALVDLDDICLGKPIGTS